MRVNIQLDIRDEALLHNKWDAVDFITKRFERAVISAFNKRIEAIALGKKEVSALGTDTMTITIDYDHTGERASS